MSDAWLASQVVKKVGLQVLSGDPKQHVWDPPASPFGLIEEVLYQDPWRLLLACMLLNKTSGRAVRPSPELELCMASDGSRTMHVLQVDCS